MAIIQVLQRASIEMPIGWSKKYGQKPIETVTSVVKSMKEWSDM